jgi:hypothetical protein
MALIMKYKPSTHIEQLQMFVCIYCAIKNIRISDTGMLAIAIFMAYGINDQSHKLVMRLKKQKMQSYRNLLTLLSKKNLLIRNVDDLGYVLHPEFNFTITKDIDLIIKIEKATI